MYRVLFRVSSFVLLVLVLGTLGYGQITKAGEGESTTRESYASGLVQQESARLGEDPPGYRNAEHSLSDDPPAGYISGTVLDQSGAVSAGAIVVLSRSDPNPQQQVRSGNNGQFVFANQPPGPFQLTVTSTGFRSSGYAGDLHPGQVYLVPPIVLAVAVEKTEISVVNAPLSPVELAEIQVKEQEKQRIFGLFPNFYVSYSSHTVPLTSKQKFRLAWKTTIDPMTFVGVGFLAAFEQAGNAYEGYGQGWDGYAKRFGASYADAITGTFIGSAILPSVLKQDPRYLYKGTGSTGSRFLYAIGSPFFCKGDNQRWQPNYSNVIGSFASGAISTLYYPSSEGGKGEITWQGGSIRLAETAFEGVLQEFVIRRLTPSVRKRASDQR